ncbi:hypothetical protein ACGFZA_07645 [Streptomyces sp. NPDC048211]|uniref:hypothetical protein n=1 Tax=Streptomyces sp. NPDC048211 TaxID=3365516 RepID=UPI0037212958
MTRQLTTQNATITTAAVEVKTLTISGKQVTLAVFRQLKEEPLIADDGTLRGEPWGTVNYHPDKCAAGSGHLHVVWQKGTEIRRSRVDDDPSFDFVSGVSRSSAHWYSSTAANRYLTALVYMGLKAGNESILDARPRSFATRYNTHLHKLDLPGELSQAETFSVRAAVPQAAVDAADLASACAHAQAEVDSATEGVRSPHWGSQTLEQRQQEARLQREKYDEALSALRAAIERCGGVDAIGEAYTAEIEAEEARRQRHRDVHDTLAGLPQLFIAV